MRPLLTLARTRVLLTGVVAALVLAGCGDPAASPGGPNSSPSSPLSSSARSSSAPSTSAPATPSPLATGSPRPTDVAMSRPGPFKPPMLTPDLLVVSSKTLGSDVLKKIRHTRGVAAIEQFAMAQFYYHENQVSYAAVDPTSFRRWTQPGVAQSNAVWTRVADGEIAIRTRLARKIQDKHDYVKLGGAEHAPTVHVGAYAQMLSPIFSEQIDAVVNDRWVRPLGMVPGNALLVSTGASTVTKKLLSRIRHLTGPHTGVQILSPHFDVHAVQTAVLTGESINSAVGTFNYTANANGSVNLPGSWVSAHISTEQVPILGSVTCNRLMLPQLRAALQEVVQRGLTAAIHPSQYGGCFVPRYIAGTHTLSYHAFGLAVDLNVPENQRGTAGAMNRQVVQIFEKWGFEWGGTWHYTDPMHFELHRIVQAR